MMKLCKKGFLAIGLSVLLMSGSLATSYGEGDLAKIMDKYNNLTVEEVYELKIKETKAELLDEVRMIENNIKTESESMILLPFLVAIIDKQEDFEEAELIELILGKEQGVILKSALIKMYKEKDCDNAKIKALVYNDNLDEQSKDYIVSINDYEVEELKDIFIKNDGILSITSMKRLMMKDSKEAYELIKKDYLKEKKASDEQKIAYYLAVGEYYKNNQGDSKEKAKIISKMQKDFENEVNERVKDQVIYSFAKMNDIDLLKSIIYDETIDKELKITAINRNKDMLLGLVNSKSKTEDIEFVIDAMKINPIIEIGNELLVVFDNQKGIKKNDYKEIISYIIENGIEGERRYE